MLRTIASLALLAFLASACGDSGTNSSGPTGPSSPTVTSLTVTGTLTVSGIGQTSQLTATAHYAKGTTDNVTAQSTWSSSDATIATVSAAGMVTSVGTGIASITASYHNVTGSTKVTVTRPATYILSGVVTESVPTTSTVLSGVRVEFTDAASQGRFATTDGSGHYEITQVPVGSYSVRAAVAGYVDSTKQVTVGANTTADFALVPMPQTIWFTRGGSISPSSPACPGDTRPCQAFALPPVHNAGPLIATLNWNGADALALQLVNVDTGQVLFSVSGQAAQFLSTQIETPGNYQLRVVALSSMTGPVALTLNVTACPN